MVLVNVDFVQHSEEGLVFSPVITEDEGIFQRNMSEYEVLECT